MKQHILRTGICWRYYISLNIL